MFRRMLSFLFLMLGFAAMFYAAIYISQFVDNSTEVKNILMIFRFLVEGAFIGAPLYFFRKLKGEGGVKGEEKRKIITLTVSLAVIVISVEVALMLS